MDLLHSRSIPAPPGQPIGHASCAVQLAHGTLAQFLAESASSESVAAEILSWIRSQFRRQQHNRPE